MLAEQTLQVCFDVRVSRGREGGRDGGVVSHGKGGDLIRFRNDAEIPKDKWPSLLAIGSLCSAVVHGKGGDIIRFLNDTEILNDTGIPKDNLLISLVFQLNL
jgi:hypothetical protein